VRTRYLALAVAALLASAIPAAAAVAGGALPLPASSASLSQSGQELVWSVQLARSFSPTGLQRDRRSLCLLLERAENGTVFGQLCIVPPAHREHQPRVAYMRITAAGPGPALVIPATITRASDAQLTATFLPASIGISYLPTRWQVISTLSPPACEPPVPDRIGCYTVFPARPALLRLHTPELVGCVPSGPSLVFNGPNAHEVALTFDDGPWNDPPTSAFLNLLEREHAVATFFEIGDQVSTYDPGGVQQRRMLADGDMIGDHSWSHPDVAALPPAEQRQQLLSAAAAIRQQTHGFVPCLWRPPYGDISPSLISLARSLGFLTIMWNDDPRDWSLPGVDAIYNTAVSTAHNGSIIIQHFGGGPRYETLAALPGEIETFRREGYRFVTVAQMLGLRLIYK
jgi:peptidoglycan-N-acetylglucosamine deacetylase